MYSLFKIHFNSAFFLFAALIIRVLFPSISWYSYFAVIITLHQFFLLFYSIDYVIPIRYVFGSLMCVQMLLGPTLAYNGLDQFAYFIYRMQIPESEYFSYALPAVIAFILGLHLGAGKLEGEVIDMKRLTAFVDKHMKIAYIFLIIGFNTSFLYEYLSFGISFLFFLLGNLKFVGLFMIILSSNKFKTITSVVVLGSVIVSSLGNGMFHDLLTWIIMLGSVYAIKYKPSNAIKLGLCIGFVALSLIIQLAKQSYRNGLTKGNEGITGLSQAYQQSKGQNEIVDLNSLAQSNVRFNQGFIITHIMKTVPAIVPYSNGDELKLILEAAFLPRILAPNKLEAGDIKLFSKYSGMPLSPGTSMGLSSLGDGYLNFGRFGGCIFMFALGFIYNQILRAFKKYNNYYPILLLFTPFVFYYPIRPDCELQTILGHVVKSLFVIIFILQYWKSSFKVRPQAI